MQRMATFTIVAAAPDGVDACVGRSWSGRGRGRGRGLSCARLRIALWRTFICAFRSLEGLEARRGVEEGDGPVDVVRGIVAPEPVVGGAVCHGDGGPTRSWRPGCGFAVRTLGVCGDVDRVDSVERRQTRLDVREIRSQKQQVRHSICGDARRSELKKSKMSNYDTQSKLGQTKAADERMIMAVDSRHREFIATHRPGSSMMVLALAANSGASPNCNLLDVNLLSFAGFWCCRVAGAG